MQQKAGQLNVLISHLGYNTNGTKSFLVSNPIHGERLAGNISMLESVSAHLLNLDDGAETPVDLGPAQQTAQWHTGPVRPGTIPVDTKPGRFQITLRDGAGVVASSREFSIGEDRIQQQSMSDILAYFRAMRSSGEIDRKDRAAHFYDSPELDPVDARGGWLDASGDTSKFLSHLTYTRMMSPQQTPLCAWAFFKTRERLAETHPNHARVLSARLRDEGLFGADFLVRFQHESGYFYTAIFDALTKDLQERVINAPLQNSVRTTRWQAAFRHGGGMAIAALAVASTQEVDGEFPRDRYLDSAIRGFRHLVEHNTEYSFDGTESIIDDYCALIAATSLLSALEPEHEEYAFVQEQADTRAHLLVGRYTPLEGAGFLRGDVEGRPYFHAAEAGMPIVALVEYSRACKGNQANQARELAIQLASDLLFRTHLVENPFGYPRQLVQPLGREPRDAFFYPHENETGYWWQGENASISSLAYAATLVAELPGVPSELSERLHSFAEDQVTWVLGKNPFDSCMLQGRGFNNYEYSTSFQNVPGGILNGITGGEHNPEDIAFVPPASAASGDVWRWAEQWIPHAGWFLLAVSSSR